MPLTEWATPKYQGHEVLELISLAPKPDHENESIGKYPEHVLLLLREEWAPGRVAWGVAWLIHDTENGRWGQRVMLSGPSPDNGNAERKLFRQYKEEITGRMS